MFNRVEPAGGVPVAPDAAATDDEALAKQLANPVASLISVPFQNNWDFGMGADDDGWRWTLNVQPVIPISLSEDWNLISRTILPIIHQDDVVAGEGDRSGLGDTVQGFFLSSVASGPLRGCEKISAGATLFPEAPWNVEEDAGGGGGDGAGSTL